MEYLPHPMDPAVIARNRRRAGRVFCEGLTCSWGTVLDLSATGVRVQMHLRRPSPGQMITVQMPTPMGIVSILARAAWVKSSGFLTWEAGCEFAPMSDDVKAALMAAAQAAMATDLVRRAA